MKPRRFRLPLVAWLACVPTFAFAQDGWTTYRGNATRTGCVDGKPGPTKPAVLWAYTSKDHYIASPIIVGNRLFVSGLGGFNVPTMTCLDIDLQAKARVAWSKQAPFLKLPSVSSPSVHQGRLIFGDGMHQTNGAVLYCITPDGLPLWRHDVPGQLVHLEGSPTIVDGKAYIGGGAAGVLCVDIDHATEESAKDKPLKLDAIEKKVKAAWDVLNEKYQMEKKNDPATALAPTEDALPHFAPHRAWQQGKETWHVDAPVAITQGKVLACSAFLDKEKVGDRALFCLDAKTGKQLWRAPLKHNPWGGPSIAGDTIIVTGSTVSYDTNMLKGAKGVVAAFSLADGKEKWSKDVPGGALGCAAIAGDLAVVTATDGKIRAFDLANGERKWIYDAKAPLFAPVAIAKNVVYAGDLRGVVHAVDLAGGTAKWTFDLGTDPAVKTPGMLYAGPIVHGGRLYLATCNLEGPNARQATAVVCLGEK